MKLSKAAFSEVEKKLAAKFPVFKGNSTDLKVWESFCKNNHIDLTNGRTFIRIFGNNQGYAISIPNPIASWKIYSF